MSTFKLRMKVGSHEFEAEGDKDDVQAQFDAWKAMISGNSVTVEPKNPPANDAFLNSFFSKQKQIETPPPATDKPLALFESDGTTITLRAYPSGEQADDAVLLVAYAFKLIHNLDILSSVLLGKSLRISGGTIERLDRVVNNQIAKGFMMKAGGVGRGTKYRLTTTGTVRAEALAKELFAKLN